MLAIPVLLTISLWIIDSIRMIRILVFAAATIITIIVIVTITFPVFTRKSSIIFLIHIGIAILTCPKHPKTC